MKGKKIEGEDLYNEVFCDNEFMHLNFQLCDDERQVKMTFLR